MSRSQRVLLARKRIENILRARILATEKQLESKISESGPLDQRCDPHILSQAIKQLQKEQALEVLHGPMDSKFYALRSVYKPLNPEHTDRRDLLFDLYGRYRRASQQQKLCGDVLESIIWKSVNASNAYVPVGSQQFQTEHFGNVSLPGKLDIIVMPRSRQNSAVLIEDKNSRE